MFCRLCVFSVGGMSAERGKYKKDDKINDVEVDRIELSSLI